jgi:hypothetical protein
MPMPLGELSRRTLDRSANCAESELRGVKFASRVSMNEVSPPKPVSSVR